MKIKEFSQKHSVCLFWSTVALLIISIVLSSYLFCDNNSRRMRNFGGDFENRGMMQKGFQDENDFRNFNRRNFQTGNNQVAPNDQTENEAAPQDTTVAPSVN